MAKRQAQEAQILSQVLMAPVVALAAGLKDPNRAERSRTIKLEPWNGDIFTARLMAKGPFITAAEDQGPRPNGFVQLQMDKDGKLNVLRLSFDDGQAYNFRRE